MPIYEFVIPATPEVCQTRLEFANFGAQFPPSLYAFYAQVNTVNATTKTFLVKRRLGLRHWVSLAGTLRQQGDNVTLVKLKPPDTVFNQLLVMAPIIAFVLLAFVMPSVPLLAAVGIIVGLVLLSQSEQDVNAERELVEELHLILTATPDRKKHYDDATSTL